MNQSIGSRSCPGHIGVTRSSRILENGDATYEAQIMVWGKRFHLGTFRTKEEAAHAYDRAAQLSREFHLRPSPSTSFHDGGDLSKKKDNGTQPFELDPCGHKTKHELAMLSYLKERVNPETGYYND